MGRFHTDLGLTNTAQEAELPLPEVITKAATSSRPLPAKGVIMHIALQGCLKSGDIPYGVTSDTGGHIRYLLELVEALSKQPDITHQIVVTRAFDAPHLGPEYARLEEQLAPQVTLWRCRGASSEYLPKEALWQEVPVLVDSLLDRMHRENIYPDLIHAHYADAGVVAMKLKTALGIPYTFTAHSLGATKARHKPDRTCAADLRRRIRMEELALSGADRLIASSWHEARIQYGMYRHHDPEKTLVNPPGCNLASFRTPAPTQAMEEVDSELRRFLKRPDLPCLLAIARPVEKKNLCALVKAYAEDPWLREQTNLVIYAGTRSSIDNGEAENRKVWAQLLKLIDDYDLYGHVAYPKHHELRQVPAIYQWAASRRGVFVNPALNEPFGLTLLEAAASGLPVVATREGGPVDILRHCEHGVLIPPTDTGAIARACRQILGDEDTWQKYSANGRNNVGYYSWSRHATQYLKDAAFALKSRPTRPAAGRKITHMLATDMDGTLLGDPQGLERLTKWLSHNRHFLFVVATGRSARDALAELKAWGAPLPDLLIADVGSSIYQVDEQGALKGIHEWQQKLSKNWRRDLCLQILDGHPALTRQSDRHQSRFKLSYFIHKASRGRADVLRQELENGLARAALKARVVCSHGNLLDVLPVGGGKAAAVDFVCQQYDIPRGHLVTAGDSGNDLDLLEEAGFGIVVANHTRELSALKKDLHHIHWARAASAAGVMEGLQLFHSDCWSSGPVLIPSASATTGRSGPDRLTGGTAELEAGA